jgi:amino acid adenylation domain-containing protein
VTTEGIQDVCELSPLQQGMLFHSIQEEKAAVLVVQFSCRIEGDLDKRRFRKAWDYVIARHSILRSSFHWEELEKPYQVAHQQASAPFAELDWTPREEATIEQEFEAFLAEEKGRPFDLKIPPAIRMTLIDAPGGNHYFVWTFHHIVLDGWSFSVVLTEVLSAYEAWGKGQEPVLEEPTQFRSYIEWLEVQPREQAGNFWRKYLDDFESPGRLASDGGMSGTTGYRREELEFSDRVTALLTAFARRQRLTLNTILQGAWAILLSRMTREEGVIWGTVVSGRPATLAGVEKTVGLFINSIPACATVKANLPVLEFLQKLQGDQMKARNHEFVSLVDIQSCSRIPRPEPLFETLVAFESYPVDELIGFSTSLQFERARIDEFPTHPLNIVVIPGPKLRVGAVYARARFGQDAVRAILRRLSIIVEGIANGGARAIGDLPWMDEEELRAELARSNPAWPGGRTERVHELFEACAQTTPGAAAVIAGEEVITYAELNRRANGIADFLLSQGTERGSFVALALDRSVDMIATMIAVLKCGAAYLPIDVGYPLERIQFLLADSEAAVLLAGSPLRGQALQFSGKAFFIEELKEHASAGGETNPRCAGTAEDPAYLMYTSGSTGKPKGVIIPHRGITGLVRNTNYIDLTPSDRIAQASNVSFDAATFEIWGALLNSASLVLIPPRLMLDAPGLAAFLEQKNVTTLFVTTALFNQFARDLPSAFRSLRWLLFGGECADPRAVRKILSSGRPLHLVNLYGPTEATVVASSYLITAVADEAATIPIGHPISGTAIYLADSALRPVPPGVAGEICIGGDGLAIGYQSRPELTAERFVPAPDLGALRVYRTGDLARRREDGAIDFIGRLDNQVKIRGFRIEPGEIESALRGHGPVADVAVVVDESRPGDKRIVAYVTGNPDINELRHYLRERLPEFMIPAIFVRLESLPLNGSGKVDWRALPKVYENEMAPEYAPADQNTSSLENAIREIWKDALGIPNAGMDDNFFDLGGHSILLMRVYGHLKNLEQLAGRTFSIVDLFTYPTIRSLARYLAAGPHGKAENPAAKSTGEASCEPIAVIGMAGRFPGAANVEELWRKLREGAECIRPLAEEEILGSGVDAETLSDSRYVRAGAPLENAELFDAGFFGFNVRELEITDPQHRVFLECAHECLENAGCDPRQYSGNIGVFAGSAMSTYLLNHLSRNEDALRGLASLQVLIGNDKDFLPSRVAYKLDLRGPAVNVQTACSTSLVAIHFACQSLRDGACEMALAGGVSILFPQKAGYAYQVDSILSPDGHCRAFDSNARGTVAGSGAGVVLLKPLRRALDDGDTIHAIIRGSAINNDGADKAGYTAPGVSGQTAVISTAIAAANIAPETIGYIEAHGTGTQLGDPIEITALNKALRGRPNSRTCAIGSIKTNLGHLDAAAGVASFIKTVMQLKNRELVPSLHFRQPNPEMPIAEGPLFVNTELRRWNRRNTPLRAGVSSFGIGGTNAHVILEEAPDVPKYPQIRDWEVLPFSGRSNAVLNRAQQNLTRYFREQPAANLSDAAWTLQTGRRAFSHRRAIVARTVEEAASMPGTRSAGVKEGQTEAASAGIGFLFPGQSAQYKGMGAVLYRSEDAFRREFDICADAFRPHLPRDLREICFDRSEGAETMLSRTEWTQAALFAIEYSLARLWQQWGVRPAAMIGHSIGEYVAACIAGVFSLEDAARIVAVRGRLMQEAPTGAMLSVRLSERDLTAMLPPDASIAVTNAPALCTVAGPAEAIAELEANLSHQRIACRRLSGNHAFHCKLMDDVLDAFRRELENTTLHEPSIPIISNVSGSWLAAQVAASAEYWVDQLRQPVRFSSGLSALLGRVRLLVECGPGQQLAAIAKQHEEGRASTVVCSLDREAADGDETGSICRAVAELWVHGAPVDWKAMRGDERRRRVPLPAYPFERQKYFIEPSKAASQIVNESSDIKRWFWRTSWMRVERPRVTKDSSSRWLIVSTAGEERGTRLGHAVANSLQSQGHDAQFIAVSDSEAHDPETFDRIMGRLAQEGLPDSIVHIGSSSGSPHDFYSLTWLGRSIAHHRTGERTTLFVTTEGAHAVTGDENIRPESALALGPCLVIPQEFEGISCRNVDIEARDGDFELEEFTAELLSGSDEQVVALRGRHRWIRSFSPVRGDASNQRLKRHGVYLITGGFGGIGMELADYLASKWQARIALVGRREPQPGSAMNVRIAAMKQDGAEILSLRADVASEEDADRMISAIDARFGHIDGVIHCAGVAGGGSISLKDRGFGDSVFQPKLAGTRNLASLLRGRSLDFFLISSSLSAVLGGYGQVDYCAANAFEDAFAAAQISGEGIPVISAGWDTWRETGMAVNTALPEDLEQGRAQTLRQGLTNAEGIAVLERLLGAPSGHILISKQDLNERVTASRRTIASAPVTQRPAHSRPDLNVGYAPARHELDRALIGLWGELLGIDQIGIHDDFFDLGGHSLLATQMIARIRELFQIEISLRTFLAQNTIAELGELLVRLEPASGQTHAIASMIVSVQDMSKEEVESRLAGRAATV